MVHVRLSYTPDRKPNNQQHVSAWTTAEEMDIQKVKDMWDRQRGSQISWTRHIITLNGMGDHYNHLSIEKIPSKYLKILFPITARIMEKIDDSHFGHGATEMPKSLWGLNTDMVTGLRGLLNQYVLTQARQKGCTHLQLRP